MRTAILPLLFLLTTAPAQGTAVTPPIGLDLPGNAALSMPARWTQGIMQVLIDHSLLPAALTNQSIHTIRLRRPAFIGEPAYPSLQRTMRVSAGFTTLLAAQLTGNLAANRPASLQVVAGPGVVTLPATAANGPGDALGATLITIALTTPLPVTQDNLFLEFEALDPPFTASPDHWVDAFWTLNGVDTGLAATVGNGGCGSGAQAPVLNWAGATAPQVGGSAALSLSHAPPQVMAWTLIGFAPQSRPTSAAYFGFGASLAAIGMTGCNQWTPIDGLVTGLTDPGGGNGFSITMPANVVPAGARIGFQMVVLEAGANPAGIAASNGVIVVPGSIGIGPHCTTVMAQGSSPTQASWPPYQGLMPVLMLDW
jgi:hypothetical protein